MLKSSCINGLFPRNDYPVLKPTSSYQTIESWKPFSDFGVYYISALIIVHVRHMVSFFHTPTLKKSRQEKKVDMKQKDEYTTCTINIGFHFNLCEKRSLLENVAPILPIQYHLISLVRTGMRKYMFLPCFWSIFFLHLE